MYTTPDVAVLSAVKKLYTENTERVGTDTIDNLLLRANRTDNSFNIMAHVLYVCLILNPQITTQSKSYCKLLKLWLPKN